MSKVGLVSRPSLLVMMWRGLRRRCPWCNGRGAFFTSWFAKDDHCHTCGLHWRRGDVGFELGAASMAVIFVMGPLVVAIGIMMAITYPDVAVVPMLIALGIGACTLPVLLYPLSYTTWQAVDIVMRPVDPETDFADTLDL